ncbi:MAG: FG-GAP-like repeat-containing protein, partial [Actinobacteria bacterium]|nr:FG-GAP-like repeat-containing protein [Actinomycetota bacterium]
AGDWDGDGDVDALVTEEGGYFGPQPRRADYLLLNDGSGTFRDSRQLAAAFPDSLWYTACLGRLDADPFPDLIALDYETDELEARTGDGTGGFGPPFTIAPPPSVREYDVAAGDLDGDGDGDVLRGSSVGVHLFRNEGASFQQVSTPGT